MILKPLKSLDVTDYDLSKFIGFVKEFANQFKSNQFIQGENISASLSTSQTVINHGLGQVPSGWLLTDNTASASVYRVSWDNKTITLKASASTTISAWVF